MKEKEIQEQINEIQRVLGDVVGYINTLERWRNLAFKPESKETDNAEERTTENDTDADTEGITEAESKIISDLKEDRRTEGE